MTAAAFSPLLLAEPCVLGLRVIWLRCLHPQMLGAPAGVWLLGAGRLRGQLRASWMAAIFWKRNNSSARCPSTTKRPDNGTTSETMIISALGVQERLLSG